VELSKLKLANNNLKSIPDDTWGNRYLHWLELDNNNISEISSAVRNAETLQLLLMSNNSLRMLPNELFISSKTNMNSNLLTLFVDGNYIVDIPAEIKYATTLMSLKIHNNYIKNIPKEVGFLKQMHDIDLRNNSLSRLPLSFLELKKSLKYIYLYNNPICRNGWLEKNRKMKEFVDKVPEAGCEKQCSIYCQDRFLTAKPCVRECNSVECDFQDGVCML
jgi:leucine-rich repeat protein SHOC2